MLILILFYLTNHSSVSSHSDLMSFWFCFISFYRNLILFHFISWKSDFVWSHFIKFLISFHFISQRSHLISVSSQNEMKLEQNILILAVSLFWASFRFQIDSMKISSEIFNSIYKIILHLTLLLTEQHELMIFRLESNVIHRADDNYTSMKHHSSTLNGKRMRRLEFKVNEFYITVQSVRLTDWHDRSVNEAV